MTRERMTPEKRRTIIVDAAHKLSENKGLARWTRDDVAATCAVPTSAETVKHYYPQQDMLRQAVLKHPKCSDKLQMQAEALGLK